MKKTHSLHRLYQQAILIVLSLAIGILGTIWLTYEYQAGRNDIKKIEADYLQEKKNNLRDTLETLTSGIQYRREKSQQQTEIILQNRMEETLAVATNLYSNNRNQESPEHLRQHIIDILMASKFGDGKGYFWILDTNFTMIAHPYNKDLIGRNLSQLTDKQGKKFIQEFVQTALNQEQGGLVNYYWTDPDVSSQLQEEKGRKKIAFVKLFQPYNWVVGVGLYVHDREETVQQAILGRFDSFRHGESGYIFTHTFDGVCLNHINKDLIGKNRWELTDKHGNKLIQNLYHTGRQPQGGFIEYIATTNPATGQPSKKLSYVKSIEEWQWIVGTGIYLDEIDTRIASLRAIHKGRMLDRIGISLILIIIAFAVSYWGSTFITKKLAQELLIFMDFFSRASKEQIKVDPQQLHITEFKKLAVDVNGMIEEQQKSQQAVLQAKKTWERTFDAVPDIIMILDKQFQIVRANRATEEMLQVPLKNLIQSKCYKVFHGTEGPPPNCPHVQLLQDQQSHHSEVFDERLQRHFSVTVSPIKDNKGEFAGSVHVARDITDQKKAEFKRIAAEEKLKKTEKMEAIGLMAGGVAHDLNNILSGVVTYPELLLLKLSKDDEFYQPIKSIQESGKRAAAVVSDLLTVARGVSAVKEVYSINSLIREYFDSPEFKKVDSLYPEVTVESNLESNLWAINCTPVHMQKVLMNLVTNAIESIEGPGTVTVSTTNQHLASEQVDSLVRGGDYVVFSVRDTGTGIAKEALNHIFEPFYSSKVMGRSGTGLGLAIVWNTVKEHDGIINVDSDDTGTVFTMYFPPSREKAVHPETQIDIDSLKGSGSILVVDDEPQQRDIASQMLTMLGYSVNTVASGEEAVVFCSEKTVDLVLLDMLMDPGINGTQTYKNIKELHPSQKAVIASGFSESNDVKMARQLGVGGFVKKPYSVEQLGNIIQEVLQA